MSGYLTTFLDVNLSILVAFGIKVLLALVVFFVGRKLIGWVCKVLAKWLMKFEVDKGIQQFAGSCLKAVLYFVLVISIAAEFGLETTSVAALFASAGVAVGLALQGSLSNFAGGILILLLKPFAIGDYILEDTSKNEGVVIEIQLFYTKLQSVDNKVIVIPNGTLANASLTNITGEESRRLDLSIGISYDSDIKKAKEILMNIMKSNECTIKEKDIIVMVEDLADSAVMIGARSWVKTGDYWTTKWAMLEEIKLTFDAEGIEIPFNQMQVHLKNVE